MPNHPKDNGPSPDRRPPSEGTSGVSRRSFIATLGASAVASTLTAKAQAAKAAAAESAKRAGPEVLGPDPVKVTLKINGKPMDATIEPATTLLEALRMNLGMTGSKEVCDRGACGCCSVLVDGVLTVACMMLALDAVGSEITTVEGLEKDGKLDPVQTAFVKHDALQCGYCTPGLVMASRSLLNRTPKPSLPEIKHALSGNICRCGTYTNVFNAVLEASGQAPVMDSKEG